MGAKNISVFCLKLLFLLPRKGSYGAVAQSVEQRTENPCVGGSIPPHTTALKTSSAMMGFFIL
jgi:hypothetical protein